MPASLQIFSSWYVKIILLAGKFPSLCVSRSFRSKSQMISFYIAIFFTTNFISVCTILLYIRSGFYLSSIWIFVILGWNSTILTRSPNDLQSFLLNNNNLAGSTSKSRLYFFYIWLDFASELLVSFHSSSLILSPYVLTQIMLSLQMSLKRVYACSLLD